MASVNLRVSESAYTLLKKLAKKNGHTLSEQLYRLAHAAYVAQAEPVVTRLYK